jgi:hypothetical protein
VIARYFGAFNKAPAGPVGVRRPHQRRLPPPLRLDQHHPSPDGQIPPDDPALSDYWARGRRKAPLPVNRPTAGCSQPRTVAATPARQRCTPLRIGHKPPRTAAVLLLQFGRGQEQQSSAWLPGGGKPESAGSLVDPEGSASDASHFADNIALTLDGLGPRGVACTRRRRSCRSTTLGSRAEVELVPANEVLGTG